MSDHGGFLSPRQRTGLWAWWMDGRLVLFAPRPIPVWRSAKASARAVRWPPLLSHGPGPPGPSSPPSIRDDSGKHAERCVVYLGRVVHRRRPGAGRRRSTGDSDRNGRLNRQSRGAALRVGCRQPRRGVTRHSQRRLLVPERRAGLDPPRGAPRRPADDQQREHENPCAT